MNALSTLGSIIALCLGSGAGIVTAIRIPEAAPGDVPWKELAGGGAAVLMLTALVVFLRFLQADRAARDAEREADRKTREAERVARDAERAADREHVEAVVHRFGDTATKLAADQVQSHVTIVSQFRDESQAARRELQDLVRDLRRPT